MKIIVMPHIVLVYYIYFRIKMARKKSNFLINRGKKFASTAQNPFSLYSLYTPSPFSHEIDLGDLRLKIFHFSFNTR
jgi:hypothetical protein